MAWTDWCISSTRHLMLLMGVAFFDPFTPPMGVVLVFGFLARQIGFSDRTECPHLFKFAAEYIIKAEGCEEEMFLLFASEPDADSLFIKLIEELERCILIIKSHERTLGRAKYRLQQYKCKNASVFRPGHLEFQEDDRLTEKHVGGIRFFNLGIQANRSRG
ncbi:hypothetical protein LXL04_009652 [Taraxacum kok-saghyz]